MRNSRHLANPSAVPFVLACADGRRLRAGERLHLAPQRLVFRASLAKRYAAEFGELCQELILEAGIRQFLAAPMIPTLVFMLLRRLKSLAHHRFMIDRARIQAGRRKYFSGVNYCADGQDEGKRGERRARAGVMRVRGEPLNDGVVRAPTMTGVIFFRTRSRASRSARCSASNSAGGR